MQSADNVDSTPPKKPRLKNSSDGKENNPVELPSPLSPEQKQRMEENKQKAMARLQAKDSLLVDVGNSWRDALDSEFSKTYFAEVWTYYKQDK